MGIGLQLTRTISAIILFIGTFLCGMAPALIKWCVLSWPNAMKRRLAEEKWIIRQSKLVTSFFMCFGGGVLFATCFIHLLPEFRKTFETYWEKERNIARNLNATTDSINKHKHHFPLPEFIMCGGFLLVYAVEEVIYYVISKFHEVGPSETTVIVRQPAETKIKEENDELIESDSKERGYGTVSETSQESHSTHGQPIETQISKAYFPPSMMTHDSQLILFKSGLSLRGILAVIALSFHSLFEGLSVGLQKTEIEIWTVLFAVAIHKLVIAVVVGIETIQAGTPIKVVIPYMMVFSFMSPLGMFIAMATYGNLSNENELVSGSLVAIATGTLVYVTFFEILLKERSSDLKSNFQLLGVFVGFTLMTFIDSVSASSHHSH